MNNTELCKWYEDHEIFGNYSGSKVDLEDIKEWLRENKEIIFRFLGIAFLEK